MLTLDQIKKAYKLSQDGMKRREISEELKANQSEISHSLNAYKLMLEEFTCKEQIFKDKIAPGADEKKRIQEEYTKIDEEHDKLQEQHKKLLEREAWLKLFVKNIIYKYKSKDKELKEEMHRYKQELDKKYKNIEEENFSYYFDLQKETKEKIEVLEQRDKERVLVKFNLVLAFTGGALITVLGFILWKNFDYFFM